MLAVACKSVSKSILPEGVHNRDIAAIALYALGIEQPEAFIASVPVGLFGEAQEKTVTENPMKPGDKLLYALCFPFIRGFNLIMPAFSRIDDIDYKAGIFAFLK